MFDEYGPSEDDAHKPGVGLPRYLEVEPGAFKDIDDCSQSEIESKILSLTMQAQALIDEAKALGRYLDER